MSLSCIFVLNNGQNSSINERFNTTVVVELRGLLDGADLKKRGQPAMTTAELVVTDEI